MNKSFFLKGINRLRREFETNKVFENLKFWDLKYLTKFRHFLEICFQYFEKNPAIVKASIVFIPLI